LSTSVADGGGEGGKGRCLLQIYSFDLLDIQNPVPHFTSSKDFIHQNT